jgi:hypothetical protein
MKSRFDIAGVSRESVESSISVNPWNDGQIGGAVTGVMFTIVTMNSSGGFKDYVQTALTFDEAENLATRLLRACGKNIVNIYANKGVEK